jgi:SAM-dependent methyltransferase
MSAEDSQFPKDAPKEAELPKPGVGQTNWGDFDRLTPFSSSWGSERGRPIDRHYIERFLGQHVTDFIGRALEVENSNYLRKYGSRTIESFDVLDINSDNQKATTIANLESGEGVPENTFDCFVMTQTLQFIYDAPAAVSQAHKLLKPGGVMLATVPGITPLPVSDPYTGQCCWTFTTNSMNRMFGDVFGMANIQVKCFGNVRTATAFLWGLSLDEIPLEHYEYNDPDYPVIITLRAIKPDYP